MTKRTQYVHCFLFLIKPKNQENKSGKIRKIMQIHHSCVYVFVYIWVPEVEDILRKTNIVIIVIGVTTYTYSCWWDQKFLHLHASCFLSLSHIRSNNKNYNFLEFDWSISDSLNPNHIWDRNSNGQIITNLVLHGCLFDWQGQASLTNYFQSFQWSGTQYSNMIIS